MKELVAFLLLRQGGNAKPSVEDVKNLLASVAIEADEAKLEGLFKDLESLDVDAAIKEGMDKLAVIPSGMFYFDKFIILFNVFIIYSNEPLCLSPI